MRLNPEGVYDYGGEIRIASHLPIEEAIKRTSKITRHLVGCMPIAFSVSRVEGPQLVGDITRGRVVVARARSLVRNASRPVFYGAFSVHEHGSLLEGRFRASCWQKLAYYT